MLTANFPSESWFGEGNCFRLTISWAFWGAWNKDSASKGASRAFESQFPVISWTYINSFYFTGF